MKCNNDCGVQAAGQVSPDPSAERKGGKEELPGTEQQLHRLPVPLPLHGPQLQQLPSQVGKYIELPALISYISLSLQNYLSCSAGAACEEPQLSE